MMWEAWMNAAPLGFSRASSLLQWTAPRSGFVGDAVFAQAMGDSGVGGLQAARQLTGRGVAGVELLQQAAFEVFHGLFQAGDFAVALTCDRGAGDVQVADVHQAAFTDGGGAEDHVL